MCSCPDTQAHLQKLSDAMLKFFSTFARHKKGCFILPDGTGCLCGLIRHAAKLGIKLPDLHSDE